MRRPIRLTKLYLAAMTGTSDYESVADKLTTKEFSTWHAYRVIQANERQHFIATLYALFYNMTLTLVTAHGGGTLKESDLKTTEDFLDTGDAVKSSTISHEESAKRAAARYGR